MNSRTKERRGFHSAADFIKDSLKNPAPVIVDPQQGGYIKAIAPAAEVAAEPPCAVAPEPLPAPFEPAVEAIAAPQDSQGDAVEDKPKGEPVRSKKKAEKPWDNAHPKMKVPYPVRLPEALHMKLTWLSKHVPDASMHTIILDGVNKEVERLLKEYWKD